MPKSGYRDCQRLHRLTKILWLIKPTRSVQTPFHAARGSSVEKSHHLWACKNVMSLQVTVIYTNILLWERGRSVQRGTDTASDCTLYTGKKKQRGTDTTMFLYFYSMYHSRPDTLETNN